MRRITNLSPRVHRWSALFVLVLAIAITAGIWTRSSAELTGPRASDRHVTSVVTSLMQSDHLLQHALDDEISERALDSFIKSLDSQKMYFYKSDVDAFMQRRDDLDDMIKKKDTSFAYEVFKRFLERVDHRVELANEFADMEHDYTADEELETDPDTYEYPTDEAEARERWRKRIKHGLMVLKADDNSDAEARDKLKRRYRTFARRMHQIDGDELLEMFLTSVTSSYDPHTTYMSPSTLDNFRITLGLNLEGIGAALEPDDGFTVVKRIIPGGAADKQGKLKPEDRIVSVGQGESGEMVDVVDMKLGDVVKLIRGRAGTVVRLGVTSPDSTETKVYTITRARIELKDEAARAEVLERGERPDGSAFKLGYIDLPSFYMDMEAARRNEENYASTTADVRRILEDFNKKGVDAVVLDLRRNGGGSLTEAINLTGLFIDKGPVVQVKDPDGRVQHYDDLEQGMAWDGPLVVLTSKFSASASEIFAGAVQDYRRGVVIGDKATHGKGTVQSLLDLGAQLFRIPDPPNLGALKITMQQFYRPNGDSTQKRGVLADVVLPSLTDQMDVSESDLDYAIEFDRVPKARYSEYNMVNPDLLTTLRDKSAERRRASEDFAKLLRNIDRYRRQKAQKSITLNEEKYLARRAEFDADKEDEKQFEDQQEADDEIYHETFYNEEVLNISVDYLKELKNNKIAQVVR